MHAPLFSLRPLLYLFAFTLLPLLLHADTKEDFEAANRAYTYGSYDEAAKLFQALVDSQGYSAPLCFNLANAQARAGHPGQAMLNYERARALAPADRDIDHNLQLARKQAGLQPNSYRWWEVMLRTINWTFWLFLIIGCLTLILLAILGTTYATAWAARTRIPITKLRLMCRSILFVGIPLTLLFGYVEVSVIGFGDRIEGVVVAKKEAVIRLSPFESAEKVGTIPEGELVSVQNRHNDFLRIEARDHHYGWVQEKAIEPVIPGSFTP